MQQCVEGRTWAEREHFSHDMASHKLYKVMREQQKYSVWQDRESSNILFKNSDYLNINKATNTQSFCSLTSLLLIRDMVVDVEIGSIRVKP